MMPREFLHNHAPLRERGVHGASALVSTDGELEFTQRLVVTDGFPEVSCPVPSALSALSVDELAERRY